MRKGSISLGKVTLIGALAGGITICAPGLAWASGAPLETASEAVFIAQIVLLLAVGRLFGEGMQRIGQPPVMGQLLAGVVLGPSLFGAILPAWHAAIFPPAQQQMLSAISQLGILLLLLLTGMETDLKLVRSIGRPAFLISLCGVAVPFACGFALGLVMPVSLVPNLDHRLVTALFLGTALSISSIKIVAAVLRDLNFMRRNLGQIIVASAIIEDTAGWIIIAVAIGIASRGSFSAAMLIRTVVGVVIFLGVCILVGRPLVYAIIRFVNDKFRSDFAVVTAILVIMGILALVTSALGVQSVLGAFMAGVLVGESPILTRHIEEQTRGLITALFMPVFFGLAGLNVNLTILRDPAILEFTAALVLVASVGKFAGAYCGGFLGGLKSRECFALGCGLNARGSTEVIVASIGLSSGVFTRNLFTMIVAMAMLTTMLMPVMLRRALARLPMDDAERERLEREDIDARGFVSTLERLVLAVDTSVPGRLASRLAGILAGARGMPMTLLALPAKKPTDQESQADEPRDEAEKGAEAAAESARELPPEQRPRKADIIMDVTADSLPEKLVRANRQGHDLLFVGMKAGRSRSGEFSGQLSGVANDFEGALAILVAADSPERALPTSGARILVPVNGTEAARRAAELACLLAPTLHASVTALYVSMSTTQASSERRRSLLHRNEEAVLREIVQLAARYRADIRTDIRTHRAPEQPILKEAPRHHLLIMGVSRRPGERLFFGNTASAVLRDWQGPILFLAT